MPEHHAAHPARSNDSLAVRRRLQHSEDRFRLLVEAVQEYAIYMLDLDGRIISWNAGAKRIKGYSESEIIGKHFSIFYLKEDIRSGKPQRDLEIVAKEGRLEDEGWRLRKDGSRFWADAVITALRDERAQLYGYGKVTRDSTERKKTEEYLRQSEERFRLLIEDVQDYAIFALDIEGRVSSWNAGAERIKGYTASEIIGSHISRFYSQEDILSRKPARELEIAVRDGRVEDEGWRLRKDGSKFWANVTITALKDDAGRLLGFAKVARDVTESMQAHRALQVANEELGKEILERKNAEAKLRQSEQSLRYLSRHLLRSQDEERKRIGRDLHDCVGQYLAVLKMNLDSMKPLRGSPLPGSQDEQIARQITQCGDLTGECIKEVRTISYLLYPPMLEESGLRSAVSWYLEGFTQRSGIKAALEVSPNLTRVPRDVELAVFRVLQESLTNVHRHSGSPTVSVRVLMNDGAVTLEVEDQGKGMPFPTLEQSHYESVAALGVGLRGMNERTRQLGGSLDLSSSERGTAVRARIPCVESSLSSGASVGVAVTWSSPSAKAPGDPV